MSESYQSPSLTPEVKPIPFIDKLAGIFTSPGEIYENLVNSKKTVSNWLIPLAILIFLTIVSTLLKFSNERIKDSLIQFQEQRFEQLIEEGKMTKEQAEIARERIEAFGGAQKIFSVVGSLIGIPITFLIVTLVYFLLGRLFFKGEVEFMTVFSIYSLSSLISSVGVIVSTILAFATGSFFANASLAIFMEVSTRKAYILASHFDVFKLWQLGVFSVGMAKAFSKNYTSAFALVFGVWAVWIVLTLVVPFFR